MKKILGVSLLLVSFTSAALANGPGFPPTGDITKPTKPVVSLLADGSGLPPTSGITKPTKPVVSLLADGSGLPPTGPTTTKPIHAVA